MANIEGLSPDEPDKMGFTQKDYDDTRDKFSEEFRRDLGEALVDAVDQYLLQFGDPKQYRHYINFVGTVSDGVLCYLVLKERMNIIGSSLADEAEQAKRREVREKRLAQVEKQFGLVDMMQGSGEAQSGPLPPGQYL